MTQIQRMVPRPRRPGELGVHSVDHFNFVVPDLKQAQKVLYQWFRPGPSRRGKQTWGSTRQADCDHRWGQDQRGSRPRS